jgi:hypothetical protein
MAQAIVNPQHVLQFPQTLKRYTPDVSGKTRDVHANRRPVCLSSFRWYCERVRSTELHTAVCCDNWDNRERTRARGVLREFDMRVAFQMSADDSSNPAGYAACEQPGAS